ncbi:MAG TPA: hypothetical protein VLY03_10350 [Bacteroidota bacterium]|nr:hypothetical protein [Bacteroidota bacterium]
MMRYITPALIVFLTAAPALSQNAGTAGAFARMGFGARGMGMGNALTAVIDGDVSTYYNPALSAFSEHRVGQATYGILSLDRSLNFLSYTQSIQPTAGMSVGLINAGVSNIDGRDADGIHLSDYSTFEDQFYLSFSNRVDKNVSIGATIKLYHSKLFDQVTTTTVGFDVGICVEPIPDLTVGAVVQDINSKYKWNTTSIYGTSGNETDDSFPNLRRIAVAYRFAGGDALVSGEFENSSQSTNLFRGGLEYVLGEYLTVRGGVNRIDLSDNATGVEPSFGFTVKNSLNGWTPEITYAYVIESFAPQGMHIITVSAVL